MDDSLATKINSSKDSIKRKVGRPKGSKKKDTATISLEPQAPDTSDQMSDCFEYNSWEIIDTQLAKLDI